MPTFRRRLLGFLRRHPHGTVALLLSPAAAWLLALTLIPLGIVVYYSFLTRGPWGTITYVWTLENYRQLLDPLFLQDYRPVPAVWLPAGLLDYISRRAL
jgi:ABC-type spermidine/putrescine transport system permease subunit I